jgi:prepilin-type N-terminal cleavage/methylation domain-containing protein
MRRPLTERGFTLIESLVALAVLAVALLLGMGLVLQLPGVVRRVDAHRQALRTMEAALEALRAGELPLASGRLVSSTSPASSAGSSTAGLAVWIEVQPVSPPGLHEVLVRARYPAAGKIVERQVATLVYRRPPTGPGPTTGPENP